MGELVIIYCTSHLLLSDTRFKSVNVMSLDPWLDLCDYWWLVPLLLALLSARLYLTRNYGVWERKGLFALPPTLLLGNNGPVVLGRMHFNDFHTEFYRKLKGKK